MSAPYECLIDMTDDETFLFTVEPRDDDNNAPTWANVSFEYCLNGCGVSLTLTDGQGIEIDEGDGTLTIGPPDRDYRLRPGQYKHGFAMRDIASGIVTQLFDGSVSVTEGNLR